MTAQSASSYKVKICGIRDGEMVQYVADQQADYIGFMFAPSRRRVAPADAAAWLSSLRQTAGSRLQSTGVFVNAAEEELQSVMAIVPLDVIQLHGQESPQYCAWVKASWPGVRVWKVFSIQLDGEAEGMNRIAEYGSSIDAVLLDTFDPVYGGGSGKTFAWERIPPFRQWTRDHGIELWIAGGLQADNVAKLLHEYAPDGVDISSGVETNGVKDRDKIQTFVQRVKSQ